MKKYLEHQARTAVLDYAKHRIAPDIVENTKKELYLLIQQDQNIHKQFIEKALQSLSRR